MSNRVEPTSTRTSSYCALTTRPLTRPPSGVRTLTGASENDSDRVLSWR